MLKFPYFQVTFLLIHFNMKFLKLIEYVVFVPALHVQKNLL